MRYFSTRDNTLRYSGAEAIKQGLSRDGGLFVPERLPVLSREELREMQGQTYQKRAARIMSLFLDDYSPEELESFADAAYSSERFDDPAVAPLHCLDDATYCLELWHGPTSAFKDMALQMLPHLLSASIRKTGEKKTVCILVATSGDTGKAALEGFRDVEHTKILVFYPRDGVSAIQKLQMATQEGANVEVCAVEGNFDDAQTGVKRIFSDETLREEFSQSGYVLSSANSINWGRVLPQIVYYVSAWCDLTREGKLGEEESLNVCVPTGNFGNILSAYYAKCMGVPIGKLICASNRNDVLTHFLRTGVYDRNRPFYTTISPSMDILISSNLERMLYALSGDDTAQVREYMRRLNETGRYEVTPAHLARLQELFWAGSCGEDETTETIRRYYGRKDYLIDPHTAVAARVLEQYRAQTGDHAPAVFASTASPYKFCDHVLRAVGAPCEGEGVELIGQLQAFTGVPAPKRLAELGEKAVRFSRSVAREDMERVVAEYLR